MRALFTGAALAAITVGLIPLQWLCVIFKLEGRRKIPGFYHRLVCRLLGVRIKVRGERMTGHALLVVANHCSWLDVPVITAVAPVVFVAKREVASWPLFGLLAKLQRSVFVDRERRQQTSAVNAEIAQRLKDGDPVVLFGEGTSSDGNRVLPFRTALIGAAGAALGADKLPVLLQPLSLAYVGLQGLPMGRQQRPIAAWYGDMDLLPHLFGVLKRGALDVVVSWGEPLRFDGQTDRKALARILQERVRQLTVAALRGGPSEAGGGHSFLPEKPLKGSRGRGGRRAQGMAARPL